MIRLCCRRFLQSRCPMDRHLPGERATPGRRGESSTPVRRKWGGAGGRSQAPPNSKSPQNAIPSERQSGLGRPEKAPTTAMATAATAAANSTNDRQRRFDGHCDCRVATASRWSRRHCGHPAQLRLPLPLSLAFLALAFAFETPPLRLCPTNSSRLWMPGSSHLCLSG